MDQPNRLVKFPCNHPLEYHFMKCTRCKGCGQLFSSNLYYCSICNFGAHVGCIDVPDIINYPCHSRHPLKLVQGRTIDYKDDSCHFCSDKLANRIYHCSICNFSIDVGCWLRPAPLTIYKPKSHNHTFTLMARKVSFTCNACGMANGRNPYLCLECGFMLHRDCIDLPRVININRHDHRISRTYNLGHGDWESCGVCRKEIDWTFGAFSCKCCPNYAVHSKCATRRDVWDGKELEDEPEDEEIEDPYKVINDKEIIHFSHKHTLRICDDNVTEYEKMRCNACICPINSDSLFKCVQCEFFLHKVCASLPRKKRHIMHNHKIDLRVVHEAGKQFYCSSCYQYFDGFRYTCELSRSCTTASYVSLDVRCGSISEPFHHELHPHPLYHIPVQYYKICGACGEKSVFVLSCIVNEFALCMKCATLPRKVKHRCDDHVLSLHHDAGNSKGQLWCDICEGKTDPNVWFYGCDYCGVTLHINCVLGDMFYLKPGNKYNGGDQLVINNGMTRPICYICEKRCMFPSFLKGASASDSFPLYVCSMKCAKVNMDHHKNVVYF